MLYSAVARGDGHVHIGDVLLSGFCDRAARFDYFCKGTISGFFNRIGLKPDSNARTLADLWSCPTRRWIQPSEISLSQYLSNQLRSSLSRSDHGPRRLKRGEHSRQVEALHSQLLSQGK